MAAEQLLAGQLPLGSSRPESELLLQQTQEALDASLDVSGARVWRVCMHAWHLQSPGALSVKLQRCQASEVQHGCCDTVSVSQALLLRPCRRV
jgi:hypothetical protein